MPTHRRSFPGDPKELYAARRWTRAMLDGHPRCEDAALIVTELGTNAVVHTASGNSDGAFHVALTVSPLAVVIEVTDSGTSETSPRVQRPTPDSTHGRGLGMVAALADRVRVQIAGRPVGRGRPADDLTSPRRERFRRGLDVAAQRPPGNLPSSPAPRALHGDHHPRPHPHHVGDQAGALPASRVPPRRRSPVMRRCLQAALRGVICNFSYHSEVTRSAPRSAGTISGRARTPASAPADARAAVTACSHSTPEKGFVAAGAPSFTELLWRETRRSWPQPCVCRTGPQAARHVGGLWSHDRSRQSSSRKKLLHRVSERKPHSRLGRPRLPESPGTALGGSNVCEE